MFFPPVPLLSDSIHVTLPYSLTALLSFFFSQLLRYKILMNRILIAQIHQGLTVSGARLFARTVYNTTNNIRSNVATNAALAFQKLHPRCYLTLNRQHLMLTGKIKTLMVSRILESISSTK